MIAERTIDIPAPLAHQAPIVESSARFKVTRAGRRGGKTVLAEVCAIVGHGPIDPAGDPLFKGIVHDLDVVWVARDYTQAGIMWHEFIRPRFKGVEGVRVNEGDRTVTLEGAGTLFVISAENIASARGMGKRLAGVIIEEAAWLDLQAALRDVILPALMDNEGWLLLISTTNAGDDGNPQKETPSYFNRICVEIRAKQRSSEWEEFHFTAQDNPKITARAFASLVGEYPAESPALKQEVYAELLMAGAGLALSQLAADKHVVKPFTVPDHWTRFGAFDWGFNHPYVFGDFAADEDGNVYLVNTVWGWKEQPDAIDAKVRKHVPLDRLRYIVGGHDLKHDTKARGEVGPTLKERFSKWGWRLTDATISRVSGLNNLRLYVQWQKTEYTKETTPRFRIMETPTNLWLLARLQQMQIDPAEPEDALKVDSDGRLSFDGFPANGDDAYDMVRYGLMSRPLAAKALKTQHVDAQDRSPAPDWKHGGRIKRVSAEEELEKAMQRDARLHDRRVQRPPRNW